jgi:hypothetical protein
MWETQELRVAIEESGLPVLAEVLAALDRWINAPDWSSEVFDAIARARVALDDFERALVHQARVDDVTWDQIAEFVGLSRQGAQKRFKGIGVEELDALDELHQRRIAAMRAEFDLERVRADAAGRPIDPALADRVMALINQQLAERAAVRAALTDSQQ